MNNSEKNMARTLLIQIETSLFILVRLNYLVKKLIKNT